MGGEGRWFVRISLSMCGGCAWNRIVYYNVPRRKGKLSEASANSAQCCQKLAPATTSQSGLRNYVTIAAPLRARDRAVRDRREVINARSCQRLAGLRALEMAKAMLSETGIVDAV